MLLEIRNEIPISHLYFPQNKVVFPSTIGLDLEPKTIQGGDLPHQNLIIFHFLICINSLIQNSTLVCGEFEESFLGQQGR
jgi:hypothetical protein